MPGATTRDRISRRVAKRGSTRHWIFRQSYLLLIYDDSVQPVLFVFLFCFEAVIEQVWKKAKISVEMLVNWNAAVVNTVIECS